MGPDAGPMQNGVQIYGNPATAPIVETPYIVTSNDKISA